MRVAVGLHQRRGADAAGSANNFLMILLGSTPMARATSMNSATSKPACGPFDFGDKRLLTTQPLGQLPLRQPLLLSRRFQEFGALLVEL